MKRKMVLIFLVVNLLLVLFGMQAGVLSRWQTVHDERDRYVHIKQDLLRLERLVADVDNGFRGYAFTKEGRFVKPMVAAEHNIPSLLNRLDTMTAPWPDLQTYVQILTGQVKELLETKRRLAMDLMLGREEDVLSYIRTGKGLELENTIVLAFQEVESRMDQRDRETVQGRDEVRVWTHLILATTTLGTLVVGMSMNRLATFVFEAIVVPRTMARQK